MLSVVSDVGLAHIHWTLILLISTSYLWRFETNLNQLSMNLNEYEQKLQERKSRKKLKFFPK